VDNPFFPYFKLELEALQEATGLLQSAAAAIGELTPIDRNFYEADIEVCMQHGLEADKFEATIAGLPVSLYEAIEASKTSIKISLGYYGGPTEQVLEGVVQKKSIKVGECFYEPTLAGVDKVFYLLQNKPLGREDNIPYTENTSFVDLVDAISKAAEVDPQPEGVVPGQDPQLSRRLSFEQQPALDALRELGDRLRKIGDHSLAIRDGKVWYGRANASQNNAGAQILKEYSFDNYLVKMEPLNEDRKGQRDAGSQTDSDITPLGYEFEMLGDPQLRPGDTVIFRVKDNNNVEKPETLTIQCITHSFSRKGGYRCRGRALQASPFVNNASRAMAPNAEVVGTEVSNLLARKEERSPAVHVGDVSSYSPGEHLADAKLGLQSEPTMASPSLEVPSGAEGFTLERRPMVAPFAWNLCGLVVPVYPGMRAVAVHNRYIREDALLNGFVWTEEMEPQPNETGDYWLCLPLNVPSDQPPNNTPNKSNKAANDLTTGDGKRVIQLKGLRIAIGEGLLENLGTRPGNVGSDNELQIEHSSGAKITMKDKEIKLEAGGRTLSIAGGKVSVT
jgi:hypothetical protein